MSVDKYGLSFVDSGIAMKDDPYQAYNQLSELRNQSWHRNKAMIDKAETDLNSTNVGSVDQNTLSEAIDGFKATVQPMVESRRFEDADFAIAEAAKDLANNKKLKGAITSQANFSKWSQEIYDSEISGRTHEEKSKFIATYNNRRKAVDIENGAVVNVFGGDAEMYDKFDASAAVDEYMKGFTADADYVRDKDGNVAETLNSYAVGSKYKQIISMEKYKHLDPQKVGNYIAYRLSTDPKFQQSLQTDAVINSASTVESLVKFKVGADTIDKHPSIASYNAYKTAKEEAGAPSAFSDERDYIYSTQIFKDSDPRVKADVEVPEGVSREDYMTYLMQAELRGDTDPKVLKDIATVKQNVTNFDAQNEIRDNTQMAQVKYTGMERSIETFGTITHDFAPANEKKKQEQFNVFMSTGGWGVTDVTETQEGSELYETFKEVVDNATQIANTTEGHYVEYIADIKTTKGIEYSVDANGEVSAIDLNNPDNDPMKDPNNSADINAVRSLYHVKESNRIERDAKLDLAKRANKHATATMQGSGYYEQAVRSMLLLDHDLNPISSSDAGGKNGYDQISDEAKSIVRTLDVDAMKDMDKVEAIKHLSDKLSKLDINNFSNENTRNAIRNMKSEVAKGNLDRFKFGIDKASSLDDEYVKAYSDYYKTHQSGDTWTQSFNTTSSGGIFAQDNKAFNDAVKSQDNFMTNYLNTVPIEGIDAYGNAIVNRELKGDHSESKFATYEHGGVIIQDNKIKAVAYMKDVDGKYIIGADGTKSVAYLDVPQNAMTSYIDNLLTVIEEQGATPSETSMPIYRALKTQYELAKRVNLADMNKAFANGTGEVRDAKNRPLGFIQRIDPHTYRDENGNLKEIDENNTTYVFSPNAILDRDGDGYISVNEAATGKSIVANNPTELKQKLLLGGYGN